MKYFVKRLKYMFKPTFTVVGLAMLAACSSVQPELPAATTNTLEKARYDYSLSVEIDASSRPQEVAARYGGEVVVWRPEAGFVILGLRESNLLSTQSLGSVTVEPNQDQVAAPEAEVEASSVWGGGSNAWSGGSNAWSGGKSVTSEPTLGWENANIWWQINLWGGHALAPRKGAGVKVAVIDGGLDLKHPAFYNRLAPWYEWKDFVDGDIYPQEERLENSNNSNYGHGTGVAGVALQIAPNATILPLRVLDSDGVGDITDVAAAIDHALAWGADVINLSLGTDEDSETLNKMIAYAAEQKVFVIASSGNTGDGAITYPARRAKQAGAAGDYLVSVGSVDTTNMLSTFSTRGSDLEITAPGERIYTAFPEDKVSYWSGTSFAAPMVSGTLALMLAEDSEADNIAERLEEAASYYNLNYISLNVHNFVGWAVD